MVGEVYGSVCLPGEYQFFVRVSLGDASKLCAMTVIIEENSGVAKCPNDAVYIDSTNDPHDGVFECRCNGV